MNLPEYVEICPWCNGEGRCEQTYNAGCGMGMYRSMGRCDMCQADKKKYQRGLGYKLKDGGKVSDSVINQIEIMNKEKHNG